MEIRTFAQGDRAELRALTRRAGEGAPTASLWGHAESELAVYLAPYMDLAPDSLFVAVADGALVGYLTGCPDSAAFPDDGERIARAVRAHRLVLRRGPAAFFARSMADAGWAAVRGRPVSGGFADPRWPAHLHINVAPEARGTGAAEGLMRGWLGRLSDIGSPGCHLQTLVENARAVRFFERMGFVAHGPAPIVPGLRHNGGRVHQRTMVRPAPGAEDVPGRTA
ncbi:acetyltransferase (GNAT) family protein [Murinocardiopsis flavida]|uniref:Acetyltransferase (GNAT) family protein n=1 Tax=Murinocardiopsis flavida TaxID=645275 RepID=A0A2P8CJA3_9ACTN|nr:GNAT family N-acetyltransferase [Murinocardiopsis flavida]PSK85045.1 acetyltransferase (GNAT) family protein [Murinocardiopsis flavida]